MERSTTKVVARRQVGQNTGQNHEEVTEAVIRESGVSASVEIAAPQRLN